MAKRYYSLLERMPGELWCIAFGDYDRAVVSAEREELVENATFLETGETYRIICTDENQAAIDAKVAELNAEIVNG